MANTELHKAGKAGYILTMGEILVEIMATERGQSFRRPGAMIGCVGSDDFGALNVERLRSDGVDVSGISVIKSATTGSAFVTYREDGERDFIFNIANSASGQLSVGNIRDDLLKDCKHFHVM